MAKFNTGQSFTDGSTVTGAMLNNITSLLDIFSGVIADQTAIAATVSTADLLLLADTDAGSSGAVNKVTVQKLLDDTLTNGTYTNANLSGTITSNRTVATSATITTGTITTGVIPTGTFGTTTSTAATITNGTITTGLIPTLTAGTTTGTAGIFTSGTIATLNSTTGTIGNLSTTLAGDFTISQGTGTLGTSGVTLGTYGSLTEIPFITVDAKGRITSATTGTFSTIPADGSITPAKLSQPMTLGSSQNALGASVVFTGIPSWVKRVTVMLFEVGTSGSSAHINVQIGDSGGLRTTNYVSTGITVDSSGNTAGVNATDGFIWANFQNSSTNRNSGTMQLTHGGLNVWVANHTGKQSTGNSVFGGGNITTALGGTLDRVQIAATGLNSGSINVMYEG